MNLLPPSIQSAIDALSNLPGIGSRSAERLIFTLLRNKNGLEKTIGQSLLDLKENIQECEKCCHYSQENICALCNDDRRNQNALCIVESPTDLIAIERTHEYKGLYHVLHGVISPMNKVKPEDIRIDKLMHRIDQEPIEEIIFALSGSTESDATSLYIIDYLQGTFKGTITQLARGIPSGGDLDYLDIGTLSRALTDRKTL